METDPCSANIFSQLWNGNAIICNKTFQNYEVSSEQAGLQSVADNAAKYYGEDSITAQVAQSTADAQSKNAISDVNAINTAIAKSAVGKTFGADCGGVPGFDLSFLGGPCISYARLKTIGVVAGILVAVGIVLYAAGIAKSFIPRG